MHNLSISKCTTRAQALLCSASNTSQVSHCSVLKAVEAKHCNTLNYIQLHSFAKLGPVFAAFYFEIQDQRCIAMKSNNDTRICLCGSKSSSRLKSNSNNILFKVLQHKLNTCVVCMVSVFCPQSSSHFNQCDGRRQFVEELDGLNTHIRPHE